MSLASTSRRLPVIVPRLTQPLPVTVGCPHIPQQLRQIATASAPAIPIRTITALKMATASPRTTANSGVTWMGAIRTVGIFSGALLLINSGPTRPVQPRHSAVHPLHPLHAGAAGQVAVRLVTEAPRPGPDKDTDLRRGAVIQRPVPT